MERRPIETRVETVTVMEWASPARAMYVLTAILGYSHADAAAILALLLEHQQRADGHVLLVARRQQRVTDFLSAVALPPAWSGPPVMKNEESHTSPTPSLPHHPNPFRSHHAPASWIGAGCSRGVTCRQRVHLVRERLSVRVGGCASGWVSGCVGGAVCSHWAALYPGGHFHLIPFLLPHL